MNEENKIVLSRDEDVRELAERIGGDIGGLPNLKTKNKDHLVGAINELKDQNDNAEKILVSTTNEQAFNDQQKKQARNNIEAISKEDVAELIEKQITIETGSEYVSDFKDALKTEIK